MDIDQVLQAIRAAKDTQRVADECADKAARVVVGRLRHCSAYVLTQLKRELRSFNMATREWND